MSNQAYDQYNITDAHLGHRRTMSTWNNGMDTHILSDSEQRGWLAFQMAFMFQHLFIIHTEGISVHTLVCFTVPLSSLWFDCWPFLE